MPEEFTPRIVRCPRCGGDSVYSQDNAFRPFCSDRCKNYDLGAWANEEFNIPAPLTDPDGPLDA